MSFLFFHDGPSWTCYKILIWENQPHQVTQMQVHILFISLQLNFHLFVCFKDCLHLS